MSSAEEQTFTPALVYVEPQLFVADLSRSCAFFTEKLGFKIIFSYGDPAFYGQVGRDGVRINLRHVDFPVISVEARQHDEDLLAATILVTNLKSLYLEFQKKGVAFAQQLRKEPWGAHTFLVADPDGNLLCFSAQAE